MFNKCVVQLWYQYDTDGSGYIEADELKVITQKNLCGYKIKHFFNQNFLRDLLKEASKSQEVSEDKLIEYTDTMVSRVSQKCTLLLMVIILPMEHMKIKQIEIHYFDLVNQCKSFQTVHQ